MFSRADTLAERDLHAQLDIVDDPRCRDVVAREPHIALGAAAELCAALVGGGKGDDLVENGLGLRFCQNAHVLSLLRA